MAANVERSLWAQCLRVAKSPWRHLESGPDRVTLRHGLKARILHYDRLDGMILQEGWLWSRLSFQSSQDASLYIDGLWKWPARAAYQTLIAVHQPHLAAWVISKRPCIENAYAHIQMLCHPTAYVAHHQMAAVLAVINPLVPDLYRLLKLVQPEDPMRTQALRLLSVALWPEQRRAQANRRFVERELLTWQRYFDHVEQHPLTKRQREAIVTNEDRTLVVAGAGSGKTSVIVGKVGYLLKSGLAQAHDILALSFSSATKTELERRMKERLAVCPTVATFHSIGARIIQHVQRKRPPLADFARDARRRSQVIDALVDNVLQDPQASDAVRQYFANHFYATPKTEFDFQTEAEYDAYVRTNELRALSGDVVRSFEELEIANFLYVQGIDFKYEAEYAFDPGSSERKAYQPDFYLPDYKIYIEHFGVDRNGHPPPWISRRRYQADMAWKESIHEENDTTLIKTYSYLKQEGRLLTTLAQRLQDHQVHFAPIPAEHLFAQLKTLDMVSPFAKLVAAFLSHFKGNGWSIEALRENAVNRHDKPRLLAFLNIFAQVFQAYENKLRAAHLIDYDDMIIQAAEHLEANRFHSPFKYVLVDEFQDISSGRARLLKALMNQTPSDRLCCVGDDWQAIYRFTGSDVYYMRCFAEEFGFTARIDLDKTFRLNNQICDVASRFILKNPSQLQKTLQPATVTETAAVILAPAREGVTRAFQLVLEDIRQHVTQPQLTVLILGRYRFSRDLSYERLIQQHTGLRSEFMTVHRSKGLESDIVVVIDVGGGQYGFPSEIVDDPILDLVLPEPESYPHAEERRLFYVALTRAKHRVYILGKPGTPSRFTEELRCDTTYPVKILESTRLRDERCPWCQRTKLKMIERHGRMTIRCLTPTCGYETRPCPRCDHGWLQRQNSHLVCDDETCGYTLTGCRGCDTGWLVDRVNSKSGVPFYGCSHYPNCHYTVSRNRE